MDDATRRLFFVETLLGTGMLESCSAPAGTGGPVIRRKDFKPAYLALEQSGDLKARIKELYAIYRSCRLCPRQCGVNRLKGEMGVCQSTSRVRVYSMHAHFGEERPLVGRGGSGTIFFSQCNLRCQFCQNWEINHRGDGRWMSDDDLAGLMKSAQETGCHNVNLVTPTHFVPNIVNALRAAMARGLTVPLVYNCGGYDPVEIIRLLDGIVDIYLPDFKYMDGAMADKYSSGARDYPERAAEAIAEMHRQVGELTVDERGIAVRGLIIRHLVLPHNIAGTDKFVKWVAAKLTRSTYVNIMAQYRPEHRAREYPELSRRLTNEEFSRAIAWAREAGLTRLDT
ncbi:MAG: radical SAM protein [Bryobacterales bacterium]|nr:radical SAM protein [Bryobacterales bacterium]